MKYVPKAITRTVGRTVLKTQMHSPTILFVAGIGGAIGATVLACRATLRVEDVLIDHEKKMLNIQRTESRTPVTHESRYNLEHRRAMIHTAGRLCKLYAPSVVVGVVSIACLTKSHRILTERNTALTAAYVTLQKFLEDYRGRVREEIGEEKERDVYYASTPVELVEDTPNGPKKYFGSAPGKRSPYSQIFDNTNLNWQEGADFNVHFLRIQEQLLTDKLRSQGNLALNEVYDRLGMPRTPTGMICGWVTGHPQSDDFVEFKIIPIHDFHSTLMVDFNVAGNIYEMVRGRAVGGVG